MTTVRLVTGGTVRSAVPTQAADMGLKVRAGIRPEDFVPTGGEPVLAGEVAITEALGEVTLLYLAREGGAAPVVAKLAGVHTGLRHRRIGLTADPARVHLFAGGRSLRCP